MRRILLYKQGLSILATLALVAVPMLRETGKVLCFGADGHVRVERENERFHAEISRMQVPTPDTEEELGSFEGHPGICIDLPLTSVTEFRRGKSGTPVSDISLPAFAVGTQANSISIRPELEFRSVAAQSLAATRASALVRSVVRLI